MNFHKNYDNLNFDIIEEYVSKVVLPNENDIVLDPFKNSLILFGCGIYGEIICDYFENNGFVVDYFCDNDTKKHGTFIKNKLVISPNELKKYSEKSVVISSRHNVQEISLQLSELNIIAISFDQYFVKKYIDRFKSVFNNYLYDDKSKYVYINLILSLITGDKKYCGDVMEGEAFYALPEFTNNGKETFVDAGAYVGDTLEQFIWKNIGSFSKIYAFEPGEKQFNAMVIRVERLCKEWGLSENQFDLVKSGLGEMDLEASYSYDENSLLGCNFISTRVGNNYVKVCTLDNYIVDGVITFIKADIEGSELAMIKGAERLILSNKPKLAISIYHRPEDMFEIAEYIHSLVPEYKMAIRHHAPNMVDTVLYCWI